MNIDILKTEAIRRYIPNVMSEVDGEIPIADKLAPFVDAAKIWMEADFLGPDDFLSSAHYDFALKILVCKAFADALPSLDIVVSPSGLAVISTDNLAPASKERVERLIASLRDYVKANICLLLDICASYPLWRSSERGCFFCSTFVSLRDCHDFRDSIAGSFDFMRAKAMAIEREMADRFLGHKLMDEIRNDFYAGKRMPAGFIFSAIRSAVIELLDKIGPSVNCSVSSDCLWRACRPIVNELNLYPGYKEIWAQEMGDKFNVPGFVNDIKGAFFF